MRHFIICGLLVFMFASQALGRNVMMTAELLGVDPMNPKGANTLEDLRSWAREPGFISDMENRVRATMRADEYLAGIESPYAVATEIQKQILSGKVDQYDLKGDNLPVVTARYPSGEIYSWANACWPSAGIPGVNNYAWKIPVLAEIHGEKVILEWGIIAPCGNDAPLAVREVALTPPTQEPGQDGYVILIRVYRQQYEVDYSVGSDIDS